MELFVFLMVQTLTTASKAEGVTYTSVGNTFNATYTYSGGGTFSVTATVNSINAFMEGTWGSGTSTTSGKFFMHKP
jgi:Na+/glutamate symporter